VFTSHSATILHVGSFAAPLSHHPTVQAIFGSDDVTISLYFAFYSLNFPLKYELQPIITIKILPTNPWLVFVRSFLFITVASLFRYFIFPNYFLLPMIWIVTPSS